MPLKERERIKSRGRAKEHRDPACSTPSCRNSVAYPGRPAATLPQVIEKT